MTRAVLASLCLLLLAVVSGGLLVAQGEGDTACPVLVEQALAEIGNNCDALDRNAACYGYRRVNTAFFEAQADDFFALPSDRAVITQLQTISTVPLNTAQGEWGIAVLNVQANVPSSLPGQAVVFMLMGDTEVENAIDPANAYTPANPVEVTALVNANLRGGPGTNFNVIGSVTAGTLLLADGLGGDRTWTRVLREDGSPAWISRDLVQPGVPGALEALPLLNASNRTPMQAFYFRTRLTGLECIEAPPSLLLVQGPDNVRVNLTINGADIQVGSTIALQTTPDNVMQLFTLSGEALVGGIVIPAGFTIQMPLGPDGREPGGPWTGFRGMTGTELQSFLALQNIPPNLLHYPIQLPTLGDIARTRAAISAPVAPVQREPGAEATDEAPDDVSLGDGVCAGFVATSPLDAATVGPYTFYWDPTPEAELYRWVLLAEDGAVLSIMDMRSISFTADLLPTYTTVIQWEAQALAGGEVVCSTQRVVIPLIGGGQRPLTPQEQCEADGGSWDDNECYFYGTDEPNFP